MENNMSREEGEVISIFYGDDPTDLSMVATMGDGYAILSGVSLSERNDSITSPIKSFEDIKEDEDNLELVIDSIKVCTRYQSNLKFEVEDGETNINEEILNALIIMSDKIDISDESKWILFSDMDDEETDQAVQFILNTKATIIEMSKYDEKELLEDGEIKINPNKCIPTGDALRHDIHAFVTDIFNK